MIGCHTALDARIVEQSRQLNDLKENLQIPITSLLNASGVIVPLGDLPDLKLAASGENAEGQQHQFVAKGEQVVAVQYRKIRFHFFLVRTWIKQFWLMRRDGKDMTGLFVT